MVDDLDALPPLRAVIKACDLTARKSLGQNFLLDLNLTRRIARAGGGPLDDTLVIEVGPGPGGLTRSLLLEGARQVIAIERDARCLPALEAIKAAAPGRLTIIHGDALEADLAALTAGKPYRIVANLPYNVATPLLARWLTEGPSPPLWQSMTLMFQREVAERIVAAPGEKHFGRLAVLAGWTSHAFRLFDIPPDAFTPRPKVTSSLVRLEPRPDAADVSADAMKSVTAAAFGQRRKMLRSSLKSLWPNAEEIILAAGLDPKARAETVAIDGFVRLARILQSDRLNEDASKDRGDPSSSRTI